MQTFLALVPDEQKLAIEQTAARKGWAACARSGYRRFVIG